MIYRTNNARIYNSDFWSLQGDKYIPRDISATSDNIWILLYLHYEEEKLHWMFYWTIGKNGNQ